MEAGAALWGASRQLGTSLGEHEAWSSRPTQGLSQLPMPHQGDLHRPALASRL